MFRNVSVCACAVTGLAAQSVLLQADFDAGADAFTYAGNTFRGTTAPDVYASGAHRPSGGRTGGALAVTLGGQDGDDILGMSGGWSRSFTVTDATLDVVLSVHANVIQSGFYESDEHTQALVAIDGVLSGYAPLTDWVAAVGGDGQSTTADRTTGWKHYRVHLGPLTAGDHTVTVGGFNNKKTLANEVSDVLIDDVLIESVPPAVACLEFPSQGPQRLVDRTDLDRFKRNIEQFASFGDRTQGSASYDDAEAFLIGQLEAAGYVVEHQNYQYSGSNPGPRRSTYVTKVGSVRPDLMIMISAHFDGRGGGGAADDDASGCSLVLECARAFASPDVKTDLSVRMIFWNNEETGLQGSEAYAAERLPLQGVEDPPGSGVYPEPCWLALVQHDMMLFDHGLPPQPTQIAAADIDIEYRDPGAEAFANLLLAGNARYAARYPAEVSPTMSNTDSVSFQGSCASVSMRENQRLAEIGNGSNPHWHQPTDVFATFSDADFRLGFDALRTTLGTVAELVGTRVAQWDSYGSGTPGTAGTPSLTADGDPRIGTTSNLLMPNTRGADTAGAIAIGFCDDSRPLLGGTALVDLSMSLVFNVAVPLQGGMVFALRLPPNPTLCGLELFAQAFQADPGSPNGLVSMSDGIRVLIGL